MSAALRLVLAAAAVLVTACTQPAPADQPPARIGIAAFGDVEPLRQAEAIAAMGFDYLEPALASAVALGEADRAAARDRLQHLGIRVEVMNWFLPPDLKVTGPTVDRARIRAYLEQALAVAESFGAEIIVFGSPAARSHPADFPREQAWQQLCEFLRSCGELIDERRFGMVIAIEALRRPESNIVNTAAEALQLARDVGHAKVRVVIDFYHLTFENEDPAVVLQARDLLVHVHIAEPRERGYPIAGEPDPRFESFCTNLRRIGYRGRMSLEGKPAAFAADSPRSLAWLRAMTAPR
jgi:D-psicose/D-tagatose/L-ribulose 3-epimerase